MKKIIEHILYNQDKKEFIVQHNLGIDRISKKSIKNISYQKLPLGMREIFDKNLFVKADEVDFTTIVKKPFTSFLTYFGIFLFGIFLLKSCLKLIEVSNLVLFTKGSDMDQTKGLLLMIALFLVVPFLIYYLFRIISKAIDFLFFGKIVRGDGFDFKLKIYGKNVDTYLYNHKELSIYQVFIKQGVVSEDRSKTTSINFWFSLIFKLLIFSCLAYVSLHYEINFKKVFSFLTIDNVDYEIYLNSNSIQRQSLLQHKTDCLSPLNSKVYNSIFIILVVIGICFLIFLFTLFFNLFFLMVSLFLGPFVFILISIIDYVFEYLKVKKSKYSEINPLIPYNFNKLNYFFIILMLTLWKTSEVFSFLQITLTLCLIVIALVNFITLLSFKSNIYSINHVPVPLYSNSYIANLLCENNRFDLLNKMNPVLFLNNKHWVESKLIDGYKIIPHCPDTLKIQLDKHYYIEYLKNEKLNKLQPPIHFFSNDKEVITALLTVNGSYLKYASRWLKSNVEIVSLAVSLNGLALEFVDESLKDNKEIVLLAVKSNGIALKFASPGLSLDKEVVLTALKSNKEAFAFIGNKLKNDEDILKFMK